MARLLGMDRTGTSGTRRHGTARREGRGVSHHQREMTTIAMNVNHIEAIAT
jgi:hypothetical protein